MLAASQTTLASFLLVSLTMSFRLCKLCRLQNCLGLGRRPTLATRHQVHGTRSLRPPAPPSPGCCRIPNLTALLASPLGPPGTPVTPPHLLPPPIVPISGVSPLCPVAHMESRRRPWLLPGQHPERISDSPTLHLHGHNPGPRECRLSLGPS